MSTRKGYVIALVVAVVTLVGTVGAAAVYALGHRAGPVVAAGAGGWRDAPRNGIGPGPGMGPRTDQGWGPGMGMGRWDDGGDATVSQAQARTLVQQWASTNAPGATVDDGFAMPMGYVFTVTKNGAIVARVMVNDDTGALVAHTQGGTVTQGGTLTPSGTA